MFALRRACVQRAAAAVTARSSAASVLAAARPKVALRAPTMPVMARRAYNETPQEAYGYRLAREFQLPDYTPEELANRNDNANLLRLVAAYRMHGHQYAKLDPLGINGPKTTIPELDPARYGLKAGQTFNLNGILHVGKTSDASISREQASLETIVKHLENTYAGRIAYEFAHIPNSSERRWFAHMVESFEKKKFSADEKKRIQALLTKSEVFDLFMTKKFPQVKRYGLEGAESMMVALDSLFATANVAGLKDIILCMPHRGRLNLLTDLLEYNPTALFAKVKGTPEYPADEADVCTGDVLSHIAQSLDLTYPQAKQPMHASLLHNPSHLEAINPVAMGKARAKQMDAFQSGKETDCYLGDRVMCVQLHGDAAFAGQGVVMETLGLSNLPHYTCGGSVHIIVNNQIGYTTPATNSRSTAYSSDVAKMINAPVIHVNGDHPEDVAYATALAVEYRNKFHKDIVLDVTAFRRWGHNELDEPGFTQPNMYKIIRARKSVPKLYEERLVAENIVSPTEVEALRDSWYKKLDADLDAVATYSAPATHLQGKWEGYVSPKEAVTKPETGVPVDTLKKVGLASVAVPESMHVHQRLHKFHIQARAQRIEANKPVDWATAEAMAFGSLMLEGNNVRISGQDVGRGTFSQRHCMLVDQETERVYTPLNAMGPAGQQGMLEIANSSLSEFAVLGFEFGYSWESPKTLPIWEAQFGDFFNGAQIIIDTFISSSEAKWLRQSGLVMLLPHGYDGTGPEHSTCRMERFLQLCNDPFNPTQPELPRNPNMHVVFPTTPAQHFHALRRQMVRNFRKPLIVVGPKTLLRLPQAVSTLEEMGPGTTFQPVLADPAIVDPKTVQRVVVCSGKFYYELAKERDAKNLTQQIALVRLEELCPFPVEEVQAQVAQFAHVKDWCYVQEEPQNQGAYTFVEPRLQALVPHKVRYIGRVSAAAPATGVGAIHRKEQAAVLAAAVAL
ncbi:hypothetical protein GGF32_003743 [Allomyces javanicus]|nr:hypothetical protein GGF32_003743 [Allomyces javanicus]